MLKTGLFYEVNDLFLQFLGYTRDEVIGKTSKSLQLFVNVEQRETMKQMVLNEGKAGNIEIEIRTKAGEIKTGFFQQKLLR